MRKRRAAVIDAFIAQVSSGEVDVSSEQSLHAGMAAAIERSGFGTTTNARKRVNVFKRIWAAPGTTQYICEAWGLAIGDPDPLARYARRLDEHAMQRDDAKLSFAALQFLVKTMLPAQVQRVQSASVVMHSSDPPAGYDTAPRMVSTPVLPTDRVVHTVMEVAGEVARGADEDDDE